MQINRVTIKHTGKGKFILEQAIKDQRRRICTALLFLQPWSLMEMGGKHHALATLSLGKNRFPLYRKLGGPQGRSGWVQKISPPTGFDPQTVQPVANRYTD
jgi:hypothetical protein